MSRRYLICIDPISNDPGNWAKEIWVEQPDHKRFTRIFEPVNKPNPFMDRYVTEDAMYWFKLTPEKLATLPRDVDILFEFAPKLHPPQEFMGVQSKRVLGRLADDNAGGIWVSGEGDNYWKSDSFSHYMVIKDTDTADNDY